MLNVDALRARASVLRALRATLDGWGYIEVPTPVRVPSPALEPSLTAFAVEEGGYLRTSPEFALKRVVAAGLPRIYEIGPCLRAEELGPWHAAEFSMLEWYRAGATLPDLMSEVEELVAAAAHALGKPRPPAFQRVTIHQLFLDRCGIDLTTATARDLSPLPDEDWDTAFFRRFIEDVEPTLTTPTFVENWPATQAALATLRQTPQGLVAARFEAYVGGIELANAFQEECCATTIRTRWLSGQAQRSDAGQTPHPVDEAALAAMDKLPRSAGIALGVDRLVATLLGTKNIQEVQVPSPLTMERAP